MNAISELQRDKTLYFALFHWNLLAVELSEDILSSGS